MRILTTLRLNLAIAILASNGFCKADSDTPDCRESADAKLWTSPAIPVPGQPFKVMAVTTEGPADTLVIRDKTGGTTPVHVTRRGGPPWSLEGEVDSLLSSGPVQIEARRDGETVGCRTLNAAAPPRAPGASRCPGTARRRCIGDHARASSARASPTSSTTRCRNTGAGSSGI